MVDQARWNMVWPAAGKWAGGGVGAQVDRTGRGDELTWRVQEEGEMHQKTAPSSWVNRTITNQGGSRGGEGREVGEWEVPSGHPTVVAGGPWSVWSDPCVGGQGLRRKRGTWRRLRTWQ